MAEIRSNLTGTTGNSFTVGGSPTVSATTTVTAVTGVTTDNAIGSLPSFNWQTAGTQRVCIDNSGDVGVGTLTPNLLGVGTALSVSNATLSALELIKSTTSTSVSLGELNVYNGTTLVMAMTGSAGGETDSGAWNVWTRPTTGSLTKRITCTSLGKLGVGTASPIARLDSVDATGLSQFRAAFDTTNSLSVLVDSTGQTSLTTAGTNAGITLTTTGTGKVILSNCAMNEFQGAAIASAATTDIGAATGNTVSVTGTTTITALGTAPAGAARTVVFAGILTLTYNATSLILPGAANITTAANDVAVLRSLGSGNWLCTSYQRASVAPATSSLGTMAYQNASAVAITGGTIGGLTSFGVRSTGAAFDLKIASSEVLTADRTLSIFVDNFDETLTVSGVANVSQNYTTSGTPNFSKLGLGVAPTYILDTFETATDFGSKLHQRGRVTSSVTVTAANFLIGIESDLSLMSITAGVTNSGFVYGARIQNYAGTTGFAGTLATQIGAYVRSGISTAAATAVITSSAALRAEVLNAVAGTTITTAYGALIQNLATAGTITNRWGLYSDTGTLGSNYFSSSVQIGHTGTALGNLESRKTTGSQIVASYDASNSLSVAVTSTGATSLTTAGTNATITVTPQVTTASALALSANSLTTGTGLYAASSSLTSGYLLDLQVSGTAAAASQTALNILTTGATATNAITTYGAQVSNTHTNATSGTNIGLLLNASGATTANYPLICTGGNVGIGTTTPAELLTIEKNQNAGTRLHVRNTTAGTGAFAQITALTTGVAINTYALNSTYTTSGRFVAASGLVESDGVGGLGLSASSGSGVIRFYTNGNNEKLSIGTTGPIAVTAAAINEVQATAIASAASIDIGAARGNLISITGTTAITALGTIQAGTERVLIFAGVLTLTHNATSLILPGGANIVTAANKCVTMRSLGAGNWILTSQS